jgi:hypothetical protein
MTHALGRVETSRATEVNKESLTNLLKILYLQGIKSDYRWQYWRLIARVVRHCPSKLDTAMCAAARGHQLIMYTRKLNARLEELVARRQDRETEPTRLLTPKTSVRA